MCQFISKHNAQASHVNTTHNSKPECNCRGGVTACPMDGKCKLEGVIYQATVSRIDNGTKETYTGLTEGSFKIRYTNHKASFTHKKKEHATTLSTHIWKLKDQNIQYNIGWKIIARGTAYNPSTQMCRLCLKEKYLIMFKPEGASLNSRSEFFANCRHKRKLLIGNG